GAVVAAEPLDVGRRLRLRREPLLELAVAAAEPLARLVVARLGRRPLGEPGEHRLARARIAVEARLLRQVADAQAAARDHAAPIGLLDAGQDAAEGALARAVAADQAHALALHEGQRDPREDAA